jgi:hypothetical protein
MTHTPGAHPKHTCYRLACDSQQIKKETWYADARNCTCCKGFVYGCTTPVCAAQEECTCSKPVQEGSQAEEPLDIDTEVRDQPTLFHRADTFYLGYHTHFTHRSYPLYFGDPTHFTLEIIPADHTHRSYLLDSGDQTHLTHYPCSISWKDLANWSCEVSLPKVVRLLKTCVTPR